MLTLSRRCAGISLALAGALTISGCASGPGGEPSGDAPTVGTTTGSPLVEPSPGPSLDAPSAPSPSATDKPSPAASAPTGEGQSPAGEIATVVPAVTFAGVVDSRVEINAFVPTIVESSGTCVADLTSGGVTRSTSGSAEADATTTWCAPLSLATSELAAGTWVGTVRYSSSTTSGQSERFEVVVP
ncbi:hypothetical protein [Oerskovia turbata]